MSQVKQAYYTQLQPLPAMDSEYNDHLHYNPLNLSHFQSGPISAPAAPSSGDDYFTFVVPHNDNLVAGDYTLSSQHEHTDAGSSYAQQNSQLRFNQWKPQPGSSTPKRGGHFGSRQRTFSDKKARSKSRLSNAITHEAEDSRVISDSPPILAPSSEASNRKPDFAKSNGTSSLKKKNPGFHIALDNLQGPNVVARMKDQNLVSSVGSESRLDLPHQSMKISDPDVLFHQNGVEWDSGQENVTPLMNPPNTSDLGYFGSYDGQLADHDASFNVSDGGMPAGYLSLPKDVERSSVARSDDNSTDFDDFANVNFDSFVPVPESFEEYNHSIPNFENNYLENSFGHNVGHHHTQHHAHVDHAANHQYDHHEYPTHTHSHSQHLPHTHVQQHQPLANHHPHQHSHQHQHPHQHTHEYAHASHNHSQQDLHSGIATNQSHTHMVPMSYREQFGQTNDSPTPTTHSLFVNRPVLERSQSAQSAITPVVKTEVKKKKKSSRVVICPICDKHISRDFTRHSRIHNEIGRFQCVFPRSTCSHKSGKFNRPYDYKKHLLNVHFTFDDPKARLAPNLKEKLLVRGHCNSCGQHFTGNDWLDEHVLNTDRSKRCPKLQVDSEFDEGDFHSGENGEDDQANMADFLKEDYSE
ncbi:hypothetical protein FT663_00956 [Candidozyma haemuli var. vulneris]|uniref:Uncharacterized protein n=1 Tax=Candidozyma haemuli TaxID=45357 RepID=A0A2V1AQB5_9ASCO|nr:hypothetical protein CXQ85_001848 [[Candida] haemuloni]KAF3993132.1 hypothetical protein FT662_00760 [[Candida] haemuloni var. vulneris]KAF3994982.1 hypothetical protein FT663_00956 [[Candida] haemuloni var. vulneris]PVH20069.1 hypothetical protein CXQ85_001848 [[Candida] haemuloni]